MLELDLGCINICIRKITPEESESSKEIRNYITYIILLRRNNNSLYNVF